MSLLVVGTLAIDTIETPATVWRDLLGGSGVHCAYAASCFAPVRLVSTVGHDWPAEHTQVLSAREIDISGVVVDRDQKTFRWHCRYRENMRDREDVQLEINVWDGYRPEVPSRFHDSPAVFLANALPAVQNHVLDQLPLDRFVVADTIDQWILDYRRELEAVLPRVNAFVLNDHEARLLTVVRDPERAARQLLTLVSDFVVIKRGAQGVLFCSPEETTEMPAFVTDVVDTTGAGDSFAGAMMGALVAAGNRSPKAIKEAVATGIVAASFNVEGFGLQRMLEIDRADIELRLQEYLAAYGKGG